jgi:hypothetical protein
MMEEVMQKLMLVAVTALIAGAIGFATAQVERTSLVERAKTSMPSIEKMMTDAKNLPVQSFDAY